MRLLQVLISGFDGEQSLQRSIGDGFVGLWIKNDIFALAIIETTPVFQSRVIGRKILLCFPIAADDALESNEGDHQGGDNRQNGEHYLDNLHDDRPAAIATRSAPNQNKKDTDSHEGKSNHNVIHHAHRSFRHSWRREARHSAFIRGRHLFYLICLVTYRAEDFLRWSCYHIRKPSLLAYYPSVSMISRKAYHVVFYSSMPRLHIFVRAARATARLHPI